MSTLFKKSPLLIILKEFENEDKKSFLSEIETLDEMLDYNGRTQKESVEKMIKSMEKVLGLKLEIMIGKNVFDAEIMEKAKYYDIKRETEIYEKIKKLKEDEDEEECNKKIKELIPELEFYLYGLC